LVAKKRGKKIKNKNKNKKKKKEKKKPEKKYLTVRSEGRVKRTHKHTQFQSLPDFLTPFTHISYLLSLYY